MKICTLLLILFTSVVKVDDDIITLINNSDIKYKKVSIAIMKHESNHGKSKLAIKNNNLYGFRGKYGYYKYNSKKESIIAYKKYESRIIAKYKVSSRDQYLAILSRIYASDSKWLYRVKSHI